MSVDRRRDNTFNQKFEGLVMTICQELQEINRLRTTDEVIEYVQQLRIKDIFYCMEYKIKLEHIDYGMEHEISPHNRIPFELNEPKDLQV